MTTEISPLPSLLQRTADLLRLSGANDFKAGAWEKAIPVVESEGESLRSRTSEAALKELPNIGSSLAAELHHFLEYGTLPKLEELEKTLPEGLTDWLDISGLGPKRAAKIHQQLGIHKPEDLKAALEDGRVADLKGFGEKTAKKLLEALQWREGVSDRCRLDEAMELAEKIRTQLQEVNGVTRLEIAGSLRRGRETIGDLDVLAACDPPETLHQAFAGMDGVEEVLLSGETKTSVRLASGRQADLRTVEDSSFAAAWIYFTGSKEHNVFLRGRAREKNLTLNEYGLYPVTDGEADREHPLDAPDEAAVYRHLDLPWTPPELREQQWESALKQHDLPDLVEASDLKGVLHAHSTWSDGKHTLEEMAETCSELGYRYLGISDHSQSAVYANGLSPDRVEAQWKEIDTLNKQFSEEGKDFRILKGIESDILKDGSLDYPDDLLAGFEFVIVSLHSQLDMPADAMQERVETALRHPSTTLLGHPTGRLLLDRPGAALNMEAVIRLAAKEGVAIEINAAAPRLELDWRWGALAREVGLKTAICPDAHGRDQIHRMVTYGIPIARKAGFNAGRVLNCSSDGLTA